jgi:uncharacterized protein
MTLELEEQWQAWREARVQRLRRPHGWLSLTALHWLTTDPTSYPEISGAWSASDGRVIIAATADDGLVLDGAPVEGEVTVRPELDGAGVEVHLGDKVIEVIQRSGEYAIRVRDPRSPALSAFAGVPTYPFSERWVVDATFEAHPDPVTVAVGASVDGLTLQQVAVGVVHFSVGGSAYRLTAFDDGGDLEILFRDATSGVTTYGGVRVLYVSRPAGGSTALTLDFNRALNMPCAFTDFATCPLPPPENVLSLAIEAGEQKPG